MKCKTLQKYLFFSIPLWLISCVQSHRPDISSIKTDIQIIRFDQDFASNQTASVQELDQKLAAKYGAFYEDYLTKIIGTPQISKNVILDKVRSDGEFLALNKEVQAIFPSMDTYKDQLSNAFGFLKYYYPATKIPKFYTFISGFDIQLPFGNNYVGIGLDMFMGAESPYYKKIANSIPHYITRRFTPQYITPRIIEGYLREEILPDTQETLNSMLDYMIYNGKLVYLAQSVLPENTPDSVLFGYTPEQMKWANRYEKDIWNYFIENRLLYETDFLKFKKYIDEAPFTTGLGTNKESAPKLGVYIGYKIVRKYVAYRGKEPLREVLNEKSAQRILNESKYKP